MEVDAQPPTFMPNWPRKRALKELADQGWVHNMIYDNIVAAIPSFSK